MITTQEIKQKAEEFSINPTDVEKDYIYGWVLNAIYTHSHLSPLLLLKGGNSLRKVYLPQTRFSKDLDFSVQESLEENFLYEELVKICKYIEENTKVKFEIDRTLVRPKNLPIPNVDVLEARIYFKGFFGEETITLKTQLDITQFDKIYLPPQIKPLIHPYSDLEQCRVSIRAQKLEEVLASKLNTLLHRRKAVDLFDLLYAIVFTSDFSVNRLEVVKTFLKKSIYEPNPNDAKQLLLEIPLNEWQEGWHGIIVPQTTLFGFDKVKESFGDLINSLFSLLPSLKPAPAYVSASRQGGHARFQSSYYFGTDNRNTIINSGRANKLIEMTYDGYRRQVEPYSFEYRVRKKDGRGVEYFWGYDRSGGKSGQQSIKRFICDKIDSVKPTDKSFTPQWAIEL